jgi:hypothetical protein
MTGGHEGLQLAHVAYDDSGAGSFTSIGAEGARTAQASHAGTGRKQVLTDCGSDEAPADDQDRWRDATLSRHRRSIRG